MTEFTQDDIDAVAWTLETLQHELRLTVQKAQCQAVREAGRGNMSESVAVEAVLQLAAVDTAIQRSTSDRIKKMHRI